MEHKNYYLVEYNDNIHLVLADSSKEAIKLFFEKKDKEYANRGRDDFDPAELKVKRLVGENSVIKAP